MQDHLVTVFGWRRDEDYFQRQAIGFTANPANANDPGKVNWGFNDVSFPRTPPPNAAKETKSYSAVLKWPQRLLALPRGSDLSVFYNSAENFTPVGGRVTIYNQGRPSPQGATKEYGFNAALFGDRLSLRVNRFETTVRGASSSASAFGTAHNNAVVQTSSYWAVEGNINPGNVPFMNAAIEPILGTVLDGWSIGGALRWQDKLGIGYPTTRNPDGSVTLDIAHPYYAPAEANVDGWVSYGRKLWKDRVDWKVQLNVRNLYGDAATIPIGVQPWGEASTVRLAPEHRWYLTNTFSF